MAESVWRRAAKDTRHEILHTVRYPVLTVVLAAVGGLIIAFAVPANATSMIRGIWGMGGAGAIGALGTYILLWIGIFLWNLFRAPYHQRNEARKLEQEHAGQIEEIKQKHTDEMNQLRRKLVDPILQENQREHLGEIKDLISNWMGSLSIRRISEVMPGTTSGTDNVRNDVRFTYLKEHLPFRELWQNFNDWDSNIQEYLNKCKALRDKIQESWKIDGTEATNSFANPILKMIDGEKSDFNFHMVHGTGHSLEEVSHQILTVNGTRVVLGTLCPYDKSFEELGHYRCLHLTLATEYQKLANDFLNQPLIAELRELSSSLITIGSNIQKSLWQILEKAEYVKHSCKDCPITEEST